MMVSSYIYGICNGNYGSSVDVTVKKIKSGTSSGSTYLYGTTDAVINGTLDVTVSDNEGMYQVQTLGGGRVEKDVTVTVGNMELKQYFYAKDYSNLSTGGNVTINVDKVSAPYWYGMSGTVNTEGKLTLTATDCASTQYTYLSNSSSTSVSKGLQMDCNNCVFKGASSIYFIANGDCQVNITGGSYEMYGQIGSINGSSPATAKIQFTDVDIQKPSSYSGTWSISNYCSGTMVLEETFDDQCTFPEDYYVLANTSSGACPTMIHMGNDYYFAGTYPVTPSLVEGADKVGFNNYHLEIPAITVKQVIFESCQSAIPETTTVTARNQFKFNNSYIVLEGTLDGACEEDAFTYSGLYMNGGTIENTAFDAMATKYYKVTLTYDKEAMTLTHSFSSSPMREGMLFAKVGDSPSLQATVKTGYRLVEATVLGDGEETGTNMSATVSGSKTTYKYDMGSKPVAITIKSEGIPIVVGKTVADPIAELNKEYTEEEPLYDFESLLIYNDADAGDSTVTYALAEDAVLPEGIRLEESKLIGTPTVENKAGTPVKFVITGRNHSTKQITLNIIVTSDEDTTQENQDDRIVVDDVAKTINCMGSSVVVKDCEEGTAIYLDDNRDGVADHSTPAVTGNYTSYTLYGLKSYTSTKPLQIVMEGGTIANLYAVYGGKVTTSDCGESVKVKLQGGRITGYVYGVSTSSTVTEGVRVDCTQTTVTASRIYSKDGNSTCKYGYVDNNGKITVTGAYTFNENLEATQLIISAGLSTNYNRIEIAEGVKVSVGNASVNQYTTIYNKGTFECTGSYSSGNSTVRHLVIGDAKVLPEDNTFTYLYYPMSFTYEGLPAGATVPKLINNSDYCKYDGVLYGSTTVNTTYLQYYLVKGYTAYYSVNDGEEISLGSNTSSDVYITSVYPTCERKPMAVKLFYVPNELEAVVKFSGPTTQVGQEYTAEEPLYDYTTIRLKNDAGQTIGSDVTYQLLPGSKLPDGLRLEDGKVIGTPTGEHDAVISTTVMITGRNGASVEVTLDYTVVTEAVEDKSINDMISFNGSVLDLKGTSVVMYADATNSSYVNIYLDENHDGIADNKKPFEYKGSTAINLSSATVYGYKDTTAAYEGDISIYANGGTISALYGAYGESESKNVVVDGKVSLYLNGANVNYGLITGYYATAKELNLYCKAGQMMSNVMAAYYPGSVQNVHFSFIEDAYYTYRNSSYYMAITEGGKVTGDVEANVGGTTNSFNTYNNYRNYCMYKGVYQTKVNGDVNYVIQGDWYTNRYDNHFASEAVISGDMNIDWRTGRVFVTSGANLMQTFAYESTIQNLNIRVAENTMATGSSTMYPYYGGTIQNVYMDVPNSFGGSVYTDLKHPSASTVTYPVKSGYIYNKGTLYVMGDYTLDKDTTASRVNVYEKANLTINEGTTLTSTGVVYAYGNITNNGILKVNSSMYVYAGAELSNKEKMTTSGTVNNYAAISNAGTWVSDNDVEQYADANVTNTGEWVSNGQVIANNANTSITNDGSWTANKLIDLQKAGSKVTNTGEWTTNYRIYVSGTDTVITNQNIWNMNYGVYLQNNSQLVNEGSFIGKYKSTNYYESVHAESAKIINRGTWRGNAYTYLNSTTFDNFGIVEINPSTETSTNYAFYLAGSSPKLINRESGTCYVNAYLYNAAGYIYNYGTFKQTYENSYYYRLGNVFVAKPVSLAKDISEYKNRTSYVNFYYPVSVEYPESAVTGETLATVYSSGIEGDENRYIKAGDSFTVTLSGYKTGFTSADVQSVTYGTEETEATLTSTENMWQGTMPYEPITILVNVVKNGATQIEIAPTGTEVEQLTVNTYNSKIFDMKTVTVTGDDESENAVSYAVSTTKPLPEGLVLNNGVISGTPKKASAEPYTAEIIVTGKNLTKATFAITFNKIEKAVPTLSLPTNIYGYTDETLAQVRGLSNPSNGTFSWPDSSVVITEKCIAGEKFDLYFTPNDTDNYDWSKLSTTVGTWNAEAGRVECKVSIRMNTVRPEYTVPTDITAVYGQTMEEIALPSDENGAFVWQYPTSLVGNVGTRSYYAKYVPTDTNRYYTVSYILISVVVTAKEMEVPVPTGLKVFSGNTIGQVELPEASGGTYKWVTASSTVVEADKMYKLVFIPADTTNYNWMTGEGVTYSKAYNGYVFDVPIDIIWHEAGVHTYVAKHDATYHWEECICGAATEKKLHTFGELQDNGSNHTATCTQEDCGYVEVSSHTYMTEHDDTYHWSECICGRKSSASKSRHSFGDWKPDAEKNCHFRICSCGYKETAAHSEEYTWTKVDENQHIGKCTVCNGGSITEDHTWDNGRVTNAPTTTSEGERTYTCTLCSATKTEIIDKLPVDHKHAYSTWVSDGSDHWQECICGQTTEKAAHTWNDGTVTVEPTETTSGKKVYKCSVCEREKTEILPPLSHEHAYSETYDFDENDHWRTCSCNAITDKEAHIWDDGEILEDATVDKTGKKQYTCTVCDATKEEIIDKLVPGEEPGDEDPDIEEPGDEDPDIEEPGDEDPDDEDPDDDLIDEEEAEPKPEGTKLSVPGKKEKYTVINSGKIDAEDDDPACVVYEGNPKSTADKVTIPDTIVVDEVEYRVISIANGAFKNNKKLTSIIIGENVMKIGDSAFEGCTSLKTVSFKRGTELKNIGKKAFYKCTSLAKIIIPQTVETIQDSAFDGCKKLTTVTFQSGSELRSIGQKAFAGCIALRKIVIPKNVTSIGANVFYGCKKLTTVTFQSGSKLKSIGQKAFASCVLLKKITIPKNVTSIGASTFSECKKLSTITIQSTKLKKVGKSAFKGIRSTARIRVPSKKLTAYKKLLKNKGQGKKVKITK